MGEYSKYPGMDESYEDYCERMRREVTNEQMESAAEKYEYTVVPMLYFGQEAPENALQSVVIDHVDVVTGKPARLCGWIVPVTGEQLGQV